MSFRPITEINTICTKSVNVKMSKCMFILLDKPSSIGLEQCSIKFPEKTSQRWPIFRQGTVLLNLKSIQSHICFFSVVVAQNICD